MENKLSSAEDLKTIRKIMEESTRFLSLSGLSGVFLGLFAIAGALIVRFFVLNNGNISLYDYFSNLPGQETEIINLKMITIAVSVLLLSLITATGFSVRKARRSGVSLWTPVSKRLYASLFLPLVTGGLFALILLFQNHIQLIIPVFLIFYGLGLISAGKFTYGEIFYLGILEITTGLLAALFPAQGLIFWIIGFGILHTVYGLFMYRKYEA
ncbi:MAG: hypothetical protein RBS38_02975 [Bacteroidales bacterium]|jgi:hypothetical protein|nr:hypothetical protein [Bacteroidales bacterium]